MHPDLEAPCASHIPASVASQSARIKSKPTAANQFCPCLTKQQGPKSTNGFQSVVCGPLGCRETIFVSLFRVRRGKKVLNTFNFYKTISSERLVQHSERSAQENILLWILANHSSVNLEAGSIVSIATRLRTGVPIPARTRDISLLQNVQTGSRSHPAS